MKLLINNLLKHNKGRPFSLLGVLSGRFRSQVVNWLLVLRPPSWCWKRRLPPPFVENAMCRVL
jgi:hypothetical protein